MTMESEYDEGLGVFAGRAEGIMGTRLEFLCAGVDRGLAETAWREMTDDAEGLSLMLNRFDPASEVSRWNAGLSGGRMSKALQEILEAAEDYRAQTGGLFDVCTGTRRADSRSRLASAQPRTAYSRSRLASVQPRTTDSRSRLASVQPRTADSLSRLADTWPRTANPHIRPADQQSRRPGQSLFTPGRRLDFGGIAKGWALRRMKGMLEENGVEDAMVSFGGSSILACGRHPGGESWKVSLPSPYDGTMLDVFALRGQSLSVSGNRPGYTGHIVDPRTGEHLTGRLLAAVVSGDPLEAEVLSTAAFVAAGTTGADQGRTAAGAVGSEGTGVDRYRACAEADSDVRSGLDALRAAFPDARINIYRL